MSITWMALAQIFMFSLWLKFAEEVLEKGGKGARKELDLLAGLLIVPGKSQVSVTPFTHQSIINRVHCSGP